MAIAASPDGDPLFDEITAFIASNPTLEQIIDFEPPENLQQRLSDLLERNRQDTLIYEEQIELDKFLQMNRFMSQLKLRARQKLESS